MTSKKPSRIFILYFLFSCCTLWGQEDTNSATLKGSVYDLKTQEPLVGVSVSMENQTRGTATAIDGTFELVNLAEGKYNIVFSYLGYAKKTLENITLMSMQKIDLGQIFLEEDIFSLKEITVTPGSFSLMGNASLSRQTLAGKDLKNMSWAEDITRAVARLPGISSSDYSSKFTIRGGEDDEVLIMLDGMELYEPFHQRDFSGGLFSIVDIETIQGVDLMTGGFSADYGNRLSGVFNMQTKHIADNEQNTSLGLSIMNARVYTDGKFAKNKGSYLFSARRGILDGIFKAVGFTENLPSYYDAMTKVEYQINNKHRFSFHALHAGDKTAIRDGPDEEGNFDKNDTKYGNTYTWLTLKTTYNPRLFSRSILYAGSINHNRKGEFYKMEPADKGTFTLSDKRKYTLWGGKQDWSWEATNKLFIRSGFEAKQISANYDYHMELDEIRVNSQEELYDYSKVTDEEISPSGQQVAAYMTARFKILKPLIMETGLRYDYTSYTKDKVLSPRVSLAYAFGKNTFLRGAWGYYYQSQFINNLDVNNGITNFNTAELAKHYGLGFEHLFRRGINFRLEAYYKDLSNISPQWENMRDHLEIFPEQRNDNARIIYNGSTSKGIEMFLKYDQGKKISWWFSYALAKATDDVKDIEFDGLLTKVKGKRPRLNDQRHTVYADLNYKPNPKWSFNLSWVYYQGWPRTDYTYAAQNLDDGELHFYQIHKEFNGTLYPAYHRMDLRTNRHFKSKRGHRINIFLHLINIYNRENLKKFDLDVELENGDPAIDEKGDYIRTRDDTYWFPFLPIIGFSWEL